MKIIKEKDGFTLLYPYNDWDMNYHLIDDKNNIEYLIDIDDVYDSNEEDIDDDFGILQWQEMKELENIETIIEYSWKTIQL